MGTWGHHNAEMGTCGRGDMLVRLGPVGLFKIFGRPSRGGTCHVPRAAGRPATGTNVVRAFRRVDRYHPRPDRTSRSGAMPGNA